MCIVVAGEKDPDTTKLFSVPVLINNGVKSTLSVYTNNFNIHPETAMDGYSLPSMLKKPTMSGLYYNAWGQLVGYPKDELSESQSFGSHTKPGAIMIVAYPIERDVVNPLIGLVDISTENMEKFRKNVESLKPISKNIFRNQSFGVETDSDNLVLDVHEIGNYLISVALNFYDLESRLDWTKFTKPSDFELRIKTLLNPKLYPPSYKWFYVVASTIKNIKDDGFGVIYPRLSADLIYFPTAHEQKENNSTNSDYNFDYELYAYSLREKKDVHYSLPSTNTIIKPLELLKNLEFIDLNKNKLKLNPDYNVKFLSILMKNGRDDNHNWFL
jgi:hypothetical protein